MHAAKLTQQWLAKLHLTVQTLLTKTPDHQIAQTSIRLTIMFGVQCLRSSVIWNRNWRTSRPGTEVSADENLERFTTRRNPHVDCQFQETSASLCKCRWQTFWTFTVILIIYFTCTCCFWTLIANTYSKTWSLTNCALILQACSICFLLFLVSLGSVETQLRWSCVFYNSFVEYSFLFPTMQKYKNSPRNLGIIAIFVVGSCLLPHPVLLPTTCYISDFCDNV